MPEEDVQPSHADDVALPGFLHHRLLQRSDLSRWSRSVISPSTRVTW